MEYYEMVANTRAHINFAWSRTIQNNMNQNSTNTSPTYNNSAFQDAQDPWPTIPLKTPSDIDSDNLFDQNMDADREPIQK